MRDIQGRFVAGSESEMRAPVGSIRIRTRHKRNGEQRAFIKIAEPNKWELLARYNWETQHGKIPRGFSIHHVDHNKLNDALENLRLESKATHLEEHRPEFADKCIAALLHARAAKTWSTKSRTGKITGRHPANCRCPIHSHP